MPASTLQCSPPARQSGGDWGGFCGSQPPFVCAAHFCVVGWTWCCPGWMVSSPAAAASPGAAVPSLLGCYPPCTRHQGRNFSHYPAWAERPGGPGRRAGGRGGRGAIFHAGAAPTDTKHNYQHLTTVSSFLSCGGGCPGSCWRHNRPHCGLREENSSVALVHKNDSYGAIMFAIVLTEVNLHNFRKQKREIGRLG